MKVLVTGATGFVGKALVEKLLSQGIEVNILTRHPSKAENIFGKNVHGFSWDVSEKKIDKDALKDISCIFHLAGESIAEGRWTDEKKVRILDSRIDSTELLLETIKEHNLNVPSIISSAAIGIYGNRGDEILTENSSYGSDYLSNVCLKWEAAVCKAEALGTRFVSLRTGIVLEKDGGALKKMLFPFKMGVGGNLANGKQFMSWIHRDDLVDLFIWAFENKDTHGSYNAVSPDPVTNAVFTKTLGSVLSRPTLFPVPAFMLKIIFGEMSSILLDSQRVIPQRLLDRGYKFKYTKLENALGAILLKKENTTSKIKQELKG